MQEFDVVIVGAGPAGLNCAQTLVNSNLRVLLLEKNSSIGPKICAGGLTEKSFNYLLAKGLPENLFNNKLNTVILHTPLNTTTITKQSPIVCTIDRKDLGQWQLSQIQNSNITVKTNARVSKVDLQQKTLAVNNAEEITYKYLIGADGATSIINKTLGIAPKKSMVGIQYLLPQSERFNKLEIFYNDSLFKMHYAWIFPHTNFVSIGCGGNLGAISFRNLLHNFHLWLQQNNIEVTNLQLQSFPFNYLFAGFQFNNVFLVGEAAGLISSFTGEGIYHALISGEEIAKKILDPNYDAPLLQKLVHQKIRHAQLEKFFQKSGYLRKAEFELIALLLKNKKMAHKILSRI